MINVGKWAFVIGLILAILSGFLIVPKLALVMVILGLVVGFLNVSASEVLLYLVAVSSLLIIGVASLQALDSLGVIADWVDTVLGNFIVFVAASGLVVAIKAIVALGKEN